MIYMCVYIYTYLYIYIYIYICVRVVRNPMLRIRALTICKYNKSNNNESPLQGTVNHDIFIVNQMVYKRYIDYSPGMFIVCYFWPTKTLFYSAASMSTKSKKNQNNTCKIYIVGGSWAVR